MKVRLVIFLVVVAFGLGAALWFAAAPAVANNQLVTVGMSVMPLGMGDDNAYVGSKKCKKCHLAQHKSWAKTKMAKALETLQPGKAAEAKKKHGLDPEKDYTKDESCLKCHVTGFGETDGYAVPDASDKKAVKKAKALEGVGCEACHGAGSKYAELHKEIQKSKRKYTVDEMIAAGMKNTGKDMCVGCHNDKGPTFDKANPFDFDKKKDKDSHEHKELKQREP